ncbi:MAG: MarR family transcriptional regulator [Methanotrichaceae archaeon]|nr:MarR family transcriptional regulator [Methanotrichaceae archaeon]
MLTETQYKILLILLDNKGHAGWELARDLNMEESNLNPLLKKLERRKFIFQGLPRKSNRPKKSERLKKREGDYKEFPYYLSKDLQILGAIIKEMVVTNTIYDIGFPFYIIRTSKYIRSMRDLFKNDFNKFIADLLRKFEFIQVHYCEIEPFIEFNIEKFPKEASTTKDRRVTEKVLEDLDSWWYEYTYLRRISKKKDVLGDIIKDILQESDEIDPLGSELSSTN